jgi:hypothetical protein
MFFSNVIGQTGQRWMIGLALACAVPCAMAQPTAEADKQAAVKDLLDAIRGDRLVQNMAAGAQAQSRQLVPRVLEQALIENKTLSENQKRAAVPALQKDALPRLAQQAGSVFKSEAFKAEATHVQQEAFAKFYTVDELKDLTAFYRSPTGRKFLEVQHQVDQDVDRNLGQKYMPQAVKALREAADKEIAAATKSVGK